MPKLFLPRLLSQRAQLAHNLHTTAHWRAVSLILSDNEREIDVDHFIHFTKALQKNYAQQHAPYNNSSSLNLNSVELWPESCQSTINNVHQLCVSLKKTQAIVSRVIEQTNHSSGVVQLSDEDIETLRKHDENSSFYQGALAHFFGVPNLGETLAVNLANTTLTKADCSAAQKTVVRAGYNVKELLASVTSRNPTPMPSTAKASRHQRRSYCANSARAAALNDQPDPNRFITFMNAVLEQHKKGSLNTHHLFVRYRRNIERIMDNLITMKAIISRTNAHKKPEDAAKLLSEDDVASLQKFVAGHEDHRVLLGDFLQSYEPHLRRPSYDSDRAFATKANSGNPNKISLTEADRTAALATFDETYTYAKKLLGAYGQQEHSHTIYSAKT